MSLVDDRHNAVMFALDEHTTNVEWVLQMITSNTKRLEVITEEVITKRNTMKGHVWMRSDWMNADIIADKIEEYEIPKVTNSEDIARIDRALTSFKALIAEKDKLMKQHGF